MILVTIGKEIQVSFCYKERILKQGGKKLKRQIRRGVFETNSSSQHSLCIMKNDEHYTPDEIAKDFYLWDDKTTGEKD